MLINRIKQFIKINQLIKPHDTIIVGLSGGPDSVFLLHILNFLQQEYALTLIAAHLDHQWRTTSHQDAIFCKQLTDSLSIPLVIAQASDIKLTKKPTRSKEEHGRLLRRTFFKQVAREYNAQAIALAHHINDQQETFFIRLIRGATLTGLASMRPCSDMYIRPLLCVTKTEILEYLHEHAIVYLQDPTNRELTFLRNKIRHTVLPALHACDTRFDKNFSKTLEHIQQTEDFLKRVTDQTFQTIIESHNNTIILDIPKLLACDEFLQPRLILQWLCNARVPFSPSTALLREILRFLQASGSGTHVFYKTWTIIKQKSKAYISITA